MQRLQTLLRQRKERGYQIAQTCEIKQKNGVWLVPSQSDPKRIYQVKLTLSGAECDCEDHIERGIRCKHAFAVDFIITKIIEKDGTTTITKTVKKIYPQDWKAYDQASIRQKELFLKLLDGLCNTIQEPAYTFGRPKMPLKDMVFSSALKVYSTFSLRRFSTDMRDAQDKGFIEKAHTTLLLLATWKVRS